jgi:type II secretory pathway component PulM
LLSTVNTQLLQTGWAGTAPALKQSADDSVQVTLSGVPFDALSTWLTGLWQQFGITVSQMNVQKTSSVGMVNVTLTLKTS